MEKKFLEALLKVQSELPVVPRNETADAGKFTYKYASMEQVWDRIGKTLTSNGFLIWHASNADGVTTYATHEFGELSSFIPYSSLDLDSRDRGIEITYAKRYNLTAIFHVIVVGEDNDGAKPTVRTAPRLAPAPKKTNDRTRLILIIEKMAKRISNTDVDMTTLENMSNSELTALARRLQEEENKLKMMANLDGEVQ